MKDLQTPPDHTPLPSGKSWVERNGFSHWAMAMIWIVVAFMLFQATAAVVAVSILVVIEPGGEFLELMTERLDILFIGNSTGQILFMGLATFLVAGMHVQKPERKTFLKLQVKDGTFRMVVLASLLFIVVQPIIVYIGYLNQLIPVPELFSELQQSQYEMIENFLRSDGVILLGLFNIALIPAICEEVMFRGYVLSAFEKSWGIWPAILISGLVFGLFHLQLTHLMPLAALGILLAVVTWLSGSLLPAIAAHFINNGGAVLLGVYYPDLMFAELTGETVPPVWVLLLSVILTSLIIRQMVHHSGKS